MFHSSKEFLKVFLVPLVIFWISVSEVEISKLNLQICLGSLEPGLHIVVT